MNIVKHEHWFYFIDGRYPSVAYFGTKQDMERCDSVGGKAARISRDEAMLLEDRRDAVNAWKSSRKSRANS